MLTCNQTLRCMNHACKFMWSHFIPLIRNAVNAARNSRQAVVQIDWKVLDCSGRHVAPSDGGACLYWRGGPEKLAASPPTLPTF